MISSGMTAMNALAAMTSARCEPSIRLNRRQTATGKLSEPDLFDRSGATLGALLERRRPRRHASASERPHAQMRPRPHHRSRTDSATDPPPRRHTDGVKSGNGPRPSWAGADRRRADDRAGAMTRRNRVDPWGDLHADPTRGLFTGNRGPLVDDERHIVRHHAATYLWIICRLRFRDWRHPLDEPHRWTPLFFLDDAVALAAGHRPCAVCRRDDYLAYRDGVDPRVPARHRTGSPPRRRTVAPRPRLRPAPGTASCGAPRSPTCPWAPSSSTPTTVRACSGRTPSQPFTFAGWATPRSRPDRRRGRAHPADVRARRCVAGSSPRSTRPPLR